MDEKWNVLLYHVHSIMTFLNKELLSTIMIRFEMLIKLKCNFDIGTQYVVGIECGMTHKFKFFILLNRLYNRVYNYALIL